MVLRTVTVPVSFHPKRRMIIVLTKEKFREGIFTSEGRVPLEDSGLLLENPILADVGGRIFPAVCGLTFT
jgi:hypothetical protein